MWYPSLYVSTLSINTFPLMNLKIQSSINETKIITTEDDQLDLLAEMHDSNIREKLTVSHDLNQKIFDRSNVSFHKMICLQFTIQKLPYQWSDE
jgi:hypothetical protein